MADKGAGKELALQGDVAEKVLVPVEAEGGALAGVGGGVGRHGDEVEQAVVCRGVVRGGRAGAVLGAGAERHVAARAGERGDDLEKDVGGCALEARRVPGVLREVVGGELHALVEHGLGRGKKAKDEEVGQC